MYKIFTESKHGSHSTGHLLINHSTVLQINIDFVLRVDPEVKQKPIYDLCGSTLDLIFDLTVPGTNIIIESILNVTAEGQCPGIQATSSRTSRGFTCNKGEILNKVAGQNVPECCK